MRMGLGQDFHLTPPAVSVPAEDRTEARVGRGIVMHTVIPYYDREGSIRVRYERCHPGHPYRDLPWRPDV